MGERLICCFTGHRRIRPEIMPELSALLDRVLDTLINDGVTEFRTGGAVGFDTLAALKVLEKREKYPQIKLVLYLPCRNQAERWDAESQAFYSHILTEADGMVYVCERYRAGCMQSFLHRLLYLCPGRKRLHAGLCEEPRLAGHQSFRHAEMIFCRLQCDFGEFGRKYLDFSGFQRYNKLG